MPLHVARSLVRAPHWSQEIELLIMMWLIGNASNSAWNKAYLGTILRGMVPHVRQLLILRRRLWRSTCREVLVRRLLYLWVLWHHACCLSKRLAEHGLLSTKLILQSLVLHGCDLI